MAEHDFKVGDWVTLGPTRSLAGLFGVPAEVISAANNFGEIQIWWDITHPKFVEWTARHAAEKNPKWFHKNIFVLTKNPNTFGKIIDQNASYYHDLLSAKDEING